MKAVIEQLRALNDIDVRLQEIQRDLEHLPKALAALADERGEVQAQIEQRGAEIMRLKIDADALDLEYKSGLEALKRLAGQMNVLRTSKEFDVVRRQMDAQRVWNSQTEDKELALLTQVDEKQKEMDALKERLAALDAEIASEDARLQKELAELKAREAELNGTRTTLARDIPERELAIYDRIVVNRGQALAKVKVDGYCAACNMRLPPQIHNLALLAQDIITCPSCGRILTGA